MSQECFRSTGPTEKALKTVKSLQVPSLSPPMLPDFSQTFNSHLQKLHVLLTLPEILHGEWLLLCISSVSLSVLPGTISSSEFI